MPPWLFEASFAWTVECWQQMPEVQHKWLFENCCHDSDWFLEWIQNQKEDLQILQVEQVLSQMVWSGFSTLGWKRLWKCHSNSFSNHTIILVCLNLHVPLTLSKSMIRCCKGCAVEVQSNGWHQWNRVKSRRRGGWQVVQSVQSIWEL